jgi:hypothetical protein
MTIQLGKVVGQLLPEDLQRSNEYRFSRKHINGYIAQAIQDKPEYESMVQKGIILVNDWLDKWTSPFTDQCKSEKHYKHKSSRLQQLVQLDTEQLIRDLLVGSAYFQQRDTFVSATAMLAHHLKLDDKRDAIQTVAELCAVLCWTGAFTLWKESLEDQMMFKSNLLFPNHLMDCINRSMYLPPMVAEPSDITSNFESPYLTHNDCRILGKQNGHMGDLCLDVLNTQNQTTLKLATDFLSTVEEEPTYELDTLEKHREWKQFKYDSYCVYAMIAEQGNKFWLDNKWDKRGRLYSQGYHITTQGTAFKKAMIELNHEELIQGVPK